MKSPPADDVNALHPSPRERQRVVGREDANEMSVRVGGIKTGPHPTVAPRIADAKHRRSIVRGRRPKVAYAPSPPLRGGRDKALARIHRGPYAMALPELKIPNVGTALTNLFDK